MIAPALAPAAPHAAGFWRTWVFSTDHKTIGKQYLGLGVAWALVGGLLAGAMRWQLAWPDTALPGVGEIGPEVFNMMVTMHGTIMVFFVAASILLASEEDPSAFIAFVALFAGFEVFFFLALGAFGRSLLGAVVWWAIFTGNLLASAGMLAILLRAHPRLPAGPVGVWSSVLREGGVAGLLGAALIMVWFLAFDAVQGQPLRTPRLLGSALLGRPEPVEAVLAYSLLHLLAFLAFGGLSAALVAAADQQPMFLFPLVILYVAFQVFVFAIVLLLARWVFDELPGWAVVVGNLLAASGMLAYYVTGHPHLARRVVAALADEG